MAHDAVPGRLPNFVFLGAAKCGSTWVFEALKAHPEAYVPPAKDIYYFSRFYDRGAGWYAEQFRDVAPHHRAVGEISVTYLHSEKALTRIGRDLPGVRLIASLRNPIERAWSGYTFLRRNDSFRGSFSEAIAARLPLVTEGAHYARSLGWIGENLGNHPLLVLFFDDLHADPVAFGRQVFTFLEIDAAFRLEDPERNPLPASRARSALLARAAKGAARRMRRADMANLLGYLKSNPLVHRLLFRTLPEKGGQTMSHDDWQRLRDLFGDEIRDLERLTGRDLSAWTREPARHALPA